MKILVAGAGSVGRSISRELISHSHKVTLMDRAGSSAAARHLC